MVPEWTVRLFFYLIPNRMTTDYPLLMQKAKAGSPVKSSLEDFGFAVSEIPWPALKVKEPAKRDWPGEHGEDVYFPPTAKLEAYELAVEFCHKGLRGADNLLNGTNRGRDGWFVPYMKNAGGESVEVSPWTLRKPYIKHGSGLGLSTGGIATEGTVVFKSAGWPLEAGGVYTLSFSLTVPKDTSRLDVHLGRTVAWDEMATNFVRLQPTAGTTRFVLKFTVIDSPHVGDDLYVVFRPVMTDWVYGTGLEIFDVKLQKGEVSNPEWTPSSADAESGYFPLWWPAYTAYRHLRDYLIGLDGNGTELKLYDTYWGRGRRQVLLQSIEEPEPSRSDVDETLAFKATFRVCDPITEATLENPAALAVENETDDVAD